MASFISALSLFILVLSSGCFALPIADEELSSPISSSLYDDLTTEQSFHLRLVSDDETTLSAETEEKRSADEHIGFQMSTSADGLLEENVTHGLRTFDELSTSEPTTFTTEQSYNDKYNQNGLSFSTVEPITQAIVLQRRGFTSGLENETENAKQEMEVKLTKSDAVVYISTSSAVLPELYTSESSTSSSSSSSVAPPVFTSQSSTSSSTSTEKYTGLMKDENEHDHDHDHDHDHENEHDHDHEHEYEQEQTTKYMKTQRTATYKSKVTPTKKSQVQLENKSEEESKVQSEDKSEEDSKDSTVPTAVFDQEALKKIPNVPNDFMILDENNDIVVPSPPTKISTTTIKNKKEEKALNQGKESSQSEEKEPNH